MFAEAEWTTLLEEETNHTTTVCLQRESFFYSYRQPIRNGTVFFNKDHEPVKVCLSVDSLSQRCADLNRKCAELRERSNNAMARHDRAMANYIKFSKDH